MGATKGYTEWEAELLHRAGEAVAVERRVPRCIEHDREGVCVGRGAVEYAHVLPEA